MAIYDLGTLHASQARLDGLVADFSGLINLEKIVNDTLERLKRKSGGMYSLATQQIISKEDFDGYFSELIRVELGKTLAIVRAKAKQKAATDARAGSSSSGVTWHQSKEGNRGYVGINSPRKRLSSNKRILQEPTGGKSGIRRHRTVSDRTNQINEYFGPDRHFILRFLEFGTDVRTAKPSGPTGLRSKASYGARGNISPRSFMHSVGSDMELAAQQLGQTLIGYVEAFIDKKFKEE